MSVKHLLFANSIFCNRTAGRALKPQNLFAVRTNKILFSDYGITLGAVHGVLSCTLIHLTLYNYNIRIKKVIILIVNKLT